MLDKDMARLVPRRAAAKVPKTVECATKPQLACRMIERAVAAKVPFAWITGDEIYGDDRRLRVWLEQQDLHFVLAVRSNQYVWPGSTAQARDGLSHASRRPCTHA
jgi:SRSO17 transposase